MIHSRYYFVTMLFSICSCIFFFFPIIVQLRFGQIATFLVSVARDRLRVELKLWNSFACLLMLRETDLN